MKSSEEKNKKFRKNLFSFADDILATLRKDVANEWPVQMQNSIVSTGMRQIISSPGEAWFLTPKGTSIKFRVSLAEKKAEMSFDRNKYELIKISLKDKGAQISEAELEEFYTDLTIFGVAKYIFTKNQEKIIFTTIMDPLLV